MTMLSVTDLSHGLRTVLRNSHMSKGIIIMGALVIVLIVVAVSILRHMVAKRRGVPSYPMLSILTGVIWAGCLCAFFIYNISTAIVVAIIATSVIGSLKKVRRQSHYQNQQQYYQKQDESFMSERPKDPF